MSDSTGSTSRLILYLLLNSVTTAGIFFYFLYPGPDNNRCFAHAKPEILTSGEIEWKWNRTRCARLIEPVNGTSVKISRGGVYSIDIQVFAEHKVVVDIMLKVSPHLEDYVGGAAPSAIGNSSFARLTQIVELQKGYELNLLVNGDKKYVLVKNSYWKILKVSDL